MFFSTSDNHYYINTPIETKCRKILNEYIQNNNEISYSFVSLSNRLFPDFMVVRLSENLYDIYTIKSDSEGTDVRYLIKATGYNLMKRDEYLVTTNDLKREEYDFSPELFNVYCFKDSFSEFNSYRTFENSSQNDYNSDAYYYFDNGSEEEKVVIKGYKYQNYRKWFIEKGIEIKFHTYSCSSDMLIVEK